MNVRLNATDELRQYFQGFRYVIVPDALPGKLVERWRRQADGIVPHARSICRPNGQFPLMYRVVTGEMIRQHWPDLFAFYQDETFIDWIRNITGERTISTSAHLQSAVNLNIMDSTESVYRWHFDAVPYTVLLYLTDVLLEDGGGLELIPNCEPHCVPDLSSTPIQLWPAAGTLLLMDGTRCYHRVTPLLRASMRFSIPLVYPNTDAAQTRPAGLDSYLY